MENELPVSPYPITVTISGLVYTLLDPCGEPSGPRVQLPNGNVTALFAHGGALSSAVVKTLQNSILST